MPEHAIDVHDLHVHFGGKGVTVAALAGVTARLASERLHLVQGPSGSGKTTLLSVVGALLTPDRGTVRVLGADLSALGPDEKARFRRRHVGFVYQAFRLLESLTALENVAMAAMLAGHCRRDADSMARETLARVGLSRKWGLRPASLSGGEKQRVAVARATCCGQSLILADEPTSSLDSVAGRSVAEQLRRLVDEESRTVIVVSHDPRLLPQADGIVTMLDGQIVEPRS